MKKRIVEKQAGPSRTSLDQLDETICKLESMGTILIQLATNEEEEPELTSLADLGRIIQSLAMEALELTEANTWVKTQENL